jgi:predicted NUDIX family NTP pyrophosphohydrolase
VKKLSAGLLVYRMKATQPEVLIAHMGSPWWAKKDKGAWSIPKGEYQDGDDPLTNAKREFREELSKEPPVGEFIELGSVEQKNNKTVTVWAVEGDLDVSEIRSNVARIEWPPHSGKIEEFPEIDRAGWFSLSAAAAKLIPAQAEFLERLATKLGTEMTANQEPTQASLF